MFEHRAKGWKSEPGGGVGELWVIGHSHLGDGADISDIDIDTDIISDTSYMILMLYL